MSSQHPIVSGLSTRGYWVSKASLSDESLDSLKKRLTMTPISLDMMPGPGGGGSGGEVTRFPLWRESEKRVYMPKCFGLSEFGACADTSRVDVALREELPFTGSLRPEQQGPIQQYLDAAHDPARMGGILSLPCGFGKTVAALYILSQLRVKAMVVVHKEFLLNQWKERIEQFLPTARIGTIRGKTVDVEGKDVVIAMLQSLSMKDYDDSVFEGIGFIIVDECHRIGTEVFSRALINRTFKYSLGISATVDRKDGMTKAFTYFLGSVLYRGKRRSDDVIISQLSFRSSDPRYCEMPMIGYGGMQRPNMSRMINNIAAFPERTEHLVDTIRTVINLSSGPSGSSGCKILVLSDRKSQLSDVHAALGPELSGFYWGGMKRAALAESETKRVMLATYPYASEGMDVPDLDTLILASPKSDVQQSVGRILRLKACDRDRLPMVIDIVDRFAMFERQSLKRAKFYKAHKYTIVKDDLARACANRGDTPLEPPP